MCPQPLPLYPLVHAAMQTLFPVVCGLGCTMGLEGPIGLSHPPAEGTLGQEEVAEQGRSVLEEELGELEPPCPGEGKSFTGRGAVGQRLRYEVVKQDKTFHGAMVSIGGSGKGKVVHGGSG